MLSIPSTRHLPGRLRALLTLAWLVAWGLALGDRGEGPWLPRQLGIWRLESAPVANLNYDRSVIDQPVWGLGDLNGDGHDELVESTARALLAYDHADGVHRTLFEHELPAGWSWMPGRGSLGPIIDLDGDGRAEIPLTLRSDDRDAWRLMVIDPLAEEPTRLDVMLPVGPDRRREPYWDGFYTVVDTMTVAGGRLALIVFCSVLYDAVGRAVLAIDARSGQIIWRYDLGPQLQPTPEVYAIGRLVPDQEPVIVLGGNSPANLGELRVGGHGDDQARLFVIDAAGQGLWSARLDSLFAVAQVRLVDLDGNGRPAIVTATANRNETDPARLSVWDPGTRTAVFAESESTSYVGLTLLPGPRLLTIVNQRELREYAPGPDGGLAHRVVRRYRTQAILSREFAAPLAGAGGEPWYVVTTQDGVIHLHDHRHRQLGRLAPTVPGATVARLDFWAPAARPRLVIEAGSVLAVVDLQDNAAAWYFALAVSWLLALGGAVGIVLAPAGRRLDLEALRRILARRLAEVAHRDFRMVRDLREFPAFLRDREAMELAGYRAQIEQLRHDLVTATIPHLVQTLAELQAAGHAATGIGSTRRQLTAARRLLDEPPTLAALADPDSQPSRRFERLSREIHADFDRLYRGLHPLVCSDGARIVQTLLTRRSPDLRAAGVRLHAEVPPAAPEAPVLADPAQLGFIIDGLVANAIQAMTSSAAPRRLEVRWQTRRNFADVLVRDSGIGIAPEDHERVFTAGVESGSGSGFGLRRSREILRLWGGDLTVAASAPGQGTTMCLSLRVFQQPRPKREVES